MEEGYVAIDSHNFAVCSSTLLFAFSKKSRKGDLVKTAVRTRMIFYHSSMSLRREPMMHTPVKFEL